MKIKSAKSFRIWFKNLEKARVEASKYYDEDFIGDKHGDTLGFFHMYHGTKDEVRGFLSGSVEMAEDGQAIYEFVQNAADSDSTKFYMFYDENYLIVINNGSVFSKEGVKSILNIGQSFGKQDPDKIGRFGIGFKLVHRLIGASTGLDEMLNTDKKGHRGPILFSWTEKSQFSNFLTTKSNNYEYVDINDDNAPWLLKILITNFPTQPKEQVKGIDYKDIEPFQAEELMSFQTFINSYIDKIDLNSLDSGTVFFLKLGDKKFEYLEKQKLEYLNGLSTSMHFLKSLDTLVINEKVIEKDKEATNVLEFIAENGTTDFNEISLTEIRDKESDAKFKICFADNANSANEIKKHPNIYKYFPAVKEVNNLSFVIHSNLFELSSNRQNLTETPINKNLLRLLSKQVIEKMEACKTENRSTFKNLFTSILMSEKPSSNSSGNGWQSEYFYNILLEYIQKTIPTKGNNFSDNAQNVKINKLKTELNLKDFGLEHIQWFEWDNEADKLLVEEAKEKLEIKKWDISDLVESANLESINNWIASSNNETYKAFIDELEESNLTQKTKVKICQIKLFRFSDNQFRSFNEVLTKDKLGKANFNFSNCFFSNNKTKEIKNELKKLGLVVSELPVEDYPKIFSSVALPDDKKHYDLIAKWCIENSSKLSAEEKKNLFLNFINEETKFDNVTEGTLKDLELFCDSNSVTKPLKELIADIKTPSWLKPYKIKQDEYFSELKPYQIQEKELFEKIILPNIDIIKDELTEAKEIKELVTFFKENHRPFFNEFILQKQAKVYAIIDKSDKHQIVPPNKETKNFIEANLSNNLIVLPLDFSGFNNEDGIIKGEELHTQILELVVVDEHKEILVDIVKYNAKYNLLQELTEFRFNSATKYTKEDYEYKILDLACGMLNENDYQNFKDKVIIETDSQNLKLSKIPPFTDKIKIDEYELNLAKLLPDTYQNSDHLSSLINQFIGLGLNKERIGNLFGISEEPELIDIFERFAEQVERLENAEQLAFVILYNKFEESIDLKKFKVLTKGGGEYDLTYNFYTKQFNFLVDGATLDDKYKGIKDILKILPFDISDESQILYEPYFTDDKFVCPDLVSENITTVQQLCLIEFLYKQWDKKNKKTIIKKIDWSKIEDTETVNILGFNPITSVYPSKYACENEALPEYLIKWIGKEECKIDFLTDLGIWTENSVIVELRKYLSGKINDFHNIRIADETVLFNSFKWLKEKEIVLKKAEQFEAFKKVVAVINDNRGNNNDLRIDEEFDFDMLVENSTEWKSIGDFSIYLYKGALPKIVKLDEIQDYIFYRYNDSDHAVNGMNIYINENDDKTKTLQKVALDTNNSFTSEDSKDIELSEIKAELEKYKKQVQPPVTQTDSFINDVNEFISELEKTEWNAYVPEIKNLLQDFTNQPKERQKLFNLIAKIKLTKEFNIKFEDSDEGFNAVKIGNEKYFVHSARGAFAYIHPNEILRMKDEGYKIALDFNTKSRIKIYKTAEEILELNTNHILAYQGAKQIEDLLAFCKANSDSNKHLLIIDKDNAGEKSKALLKLLNIENDYQ